MAQHRRHDIPTVGTHGTQAVHLSHAVKAQIRRRANRAARREYAPQIQADRKAVAIARRSGDKEIASIQNMTGVVDSALQQQLQQLKHSGLTGQNLKMAIQELSARRADLPVGEQLLVSDARQTEHSAVQDARMQVLQDRADRATQAAQNFNSGFNSALTDAQSALGRQRSARQSGSSSSSSSSDKKARRQEYVAAVHEIDRLLTQNPALAKALYTNTNYVSPDGKTTAAPVQVIADLEAKVRAAEGVGFAAAQKAINRLRKMLAQTKPYANDVVGPPSPYGG